MQITELTFSSSLPVDGYGPGFFRVAGQVHHGPVLVAGDRVLPWEGLSDGAALMALAGQIDVLLIGTGAEISPLPTELRDRLEAAGLGVEAMATPPAARTYNVLLSEKRRVAVALLPV
ncbi:uncharacterized protein C8N32_11614 [Rhodovulum imhoffii]|uniref:Mth938-like domain-containing protein n=1 Tax=Rhodovulum imhoffii TaxID=365340 RepID=A0A2T5BPX6_9RHOB|nr:Mth938-like domain-containing protein [Rhodovulum imhoffii]MBK5933108.1 hypothetical protein [Rhodovulum imhoffii]PTN01141.1 uncharacterized protein C8N32_11614 [Rhodovulum imhoffii]